MKFTLNTTKHHETLKIPMVLFHQPLAPKCDLIDSTGRPLSAWQRPMKVWDLKGVVIYLYCVRL